MWYAVCYAVEHFGCGNVYFGRSVWGNREKKECWCTTYVYQGVTWVKFIRYFKYCTKQRSSLGTGVETKNCGFGPGSNTAIKSYRKSESRQPIRTKV
jgi:hypothetical protein